MLHLKTYKHLTIATAFFIAGQAASAQTDLCQNGSVKEKAACQAELKSFVKMSHIFTQCVSAHVSCPAQKDMTPCMDFQNRVNICYDEKGSYAACEKTIMSGSKKMYSEMGIDPSATAEGYSCLQEPQYKPSS